MAKEFIKVPIDKLPGNNRGVYFKLNGKEAHTTWGIYMAEGSLTSLMTPPNNKAYVTSECPGEHGKRVVIPAATHRADRDVTLILHLVAPTIESFFQQYASFCEELKKGTIDIETHFQPGVVYHCTYTSCNQFEQWDRQLGKFTLRLNEPNPENRV